MATFKIYKSSNSQYYWVLKAANGETIAVSEMYVYKSSAQHTIARVKALADSAGISDYT